MSPRRAEHEVRFVRRLRQVGEVAVAPSAGDEFPPGAAEPPEGLSRRELLQLLGAGMSLAGLAACRRPVETIVPYVQPPEEIVPGVPLTYATSMPFGLDAYGLLVESHEGRPTKIEGNPDHPVTRGASTAWMQASLYQLYDPDRSRRVLHRGQPSDWKAAEEALREIRERHLASRGRGLAVLTPPWASPTLAAIHEAFARAYPEALWVAWDPVDPGAGLRGVAMAAGAPARAWYRLERARVVLALDHDLLVTDPQAVRHARDFARGRRLTGPGDSMNRIYAVEPSVTPTGSVADHRLRLARSRVGAFVAALAAALGRRGVSLPAPARAGAGLPEGASAWVEAVADDLAAHRGACVLTVGPGQGEAVHAAVAALNAALGAVGRTVEYLQPRDALLPEPDGLRRLVEAMQAGEVQTLLVAEANPAYDAPGDLDWEAAVAKVETSVHTGVFADETSRQSTWHLPGAHYLESWADVRAADGTAGVVQPLIAPLFDGRTTAELLQLLVTGETVAAYDRVRARWTSLLETEGESVSWERALHDGLLAPTVGSAPVVRPRVEAVQALGPEAESGSDAGGGIELVFDPSPAVADGRFGNVAWLQELPDPVTKLTWDNALLLSFGTARELGLAEGDRVDVEAAGANVNLPVFVVGGVAPGCGVVHLGYGRTAAGRVGDGVGVNVAAVRASGRPGYTPDARVTRTGSGYLLAGTQDHWSLEGRPIILEATLARYREEPEFAKHAVEHPPLRSLWQEPDYATGYQWGMSIDLNACVGCNACVIACQSENNIPVVGKDQVARGREMQWIRVDRYYRHEGGDPDEAGIVFQPVTCMHCENAPCEEVCPVGATMHDAEGLNTMVYNRCIGTRYCSNNCPYKVRRFNFYNFTKDTPELLKMAQNPDVTVRSRGVMEKCTFCVQRIREAEFRAKSEDRTLRDGEFQTACQQACPARAIEFGNLNDPNSLVARRRGLDRAYIVLEELNNQPRTHYLARVRNPNPALEPAGGAEAESHARAPRARTAGRREAQA